ncbi:hypothetical protein MTO96_045485, partial [Rhipicephalus appendiculatus]
KAYQLLERVKNLVLNLQEVGDMAEAAGPHPSSCLAKWCGESRTRYRTQQPGIGPLGEGALQTLQSIFSISWVEVRMVPVQSQCLSG